MIADWWNGQIARLRGGVVETLMAVEAPGGVEVDPAGVIYATAGRQGLVIRIDPTGRSSVVAGGGSSTEDGPALKASLNDPNHLAIRPDGALVVADTNADRVVEVRDGYLRRIAGTGDCCSGVGDGDLAASARLQYPYSVAATATETFVGEGYEGDRIRRIDHDGRITTFMGTKYARHGGDGGHRRDAQLVPTAIVPDGAGGLYAYDASAYRIRHVDAAGTVRTVAGAGRPPKDWYGYPVCSTDDDGPAAAVVICQVTDMRMGPDGLLWFSDGRRLRSLSGGVVTTRVGNVVAASGRRSAPPDLVHLRVVQTFAFGPSGQLHLVDDGTLRRLDPDGMVRDVTGLGSTSIEFADDGTLYAGVDRHLVTVAPDGTRTVVAGNGEYGTAGDGGPALAAQMYGPNALRWHAGSLWFGDSFRVRRLDPDGRVQHVAGSATNGDEGDGGLATNAQLTHVYGLAHLGDELLISTNERIRAVADGVPEPEPTPAPSPAPAELPGGDFRPLAPYRVADTRRAGAPLGPGGTLDVRATGVPGVPATGVAGLVLNVTGTGATRSTYLTVWPAGRPLPRTSNLNLPAGATRATLAHTGVSAGGVARIRNAAGSAHVVVDVVGWYATSGGDRLHAVAPSRAADTRKSAPLTGGAPRMVPLAVPAGATAAVVNVTVTGATATAHLAAYQGGTAWPGTSTLNVTRGATVANLAVVPLGADRRIALRLSNGSAHAVVDVLGWYAPPAGDAGRVVLGTPSRLLDTRTYAGALGPGGTVDVEVHGRAGVPANAAAALVTLTAVTPTKGTYLTAYPAGVPYPGTSNVNAPAGSIVANAAVVPIGADGRIRVRNATGSAHVLVDLVGWSTGEAP